MIPCIRWHSLAQCKELNMEALLVSITDTAKALNLGRTSVYSLIDEGKLDTLKMGRRRLVTVASIKRLAGESE